MDIKKDNLLETVYYQVLHFAVHNGFFFTTLVLLSVHIVLLSTMIYARVTPLIYINILSCVIYMFCTLLCKYGHPAPVYMSIFCEVSMYVILSTYYIGWDCAPYCYLLGITPTLIYFGYYLMGTKHKELLFLLLLCDFIIYVILYFNFHNVIPPYIVSEGVKNFSVIFATFVLVFGVIFYSIVYIYGAELKENSLKQENEQLTIAATTDTLTHLLNRRGFLAIIEGLMKEPNSYFCIAFCDIDNFKRVNDGYGHDAGDEVLKHIAKIIRKEMTGCDICRWGGEEIVILMKDYDIGVAKSKMEYIRKRVESSSTLFYNKKIDHTLTIGVEEYNHQVTKPDDIIKVADARMYYGKQHGKNVVISEDMYDQNEESEQPEQE